MKKSFYCCLIILMVLAVSPIFAEQLTVGKNQKFTTIQSAIDEAKEGDIIIIQAGEYKSEKPLMNISGKKNIKLVGQGVVNLICTSTYEVVININESENIILQNLRASHNPVAEGCAEGVLSINKSKKVSIERCELNGCGTVGISASECEELNIFNNFIHSNTSFGLYIYKCQNVNITGNRITRNENAGTISSSKNVRLARNIIMQNKNNQIKQNN